MTATKIISIYIILIPIIRLIRFPGTAFSITQILFIFISALFIFSKNRQNNQLNLVGLRSFLCLNLYMLIQCIIVQLYLPKQIELISYYTIIKVTVSFVLTSVCLLYIASSHFDYNYAMIFYEKFSVVLSIIVSIQWLFLLFGYKMQIIPYDYAIYDCYSQIDLAEFSEFRPSSLFFEPSHFSVYVIPVICYLLFSDEKIDSKKIAYIIIITLGVLFSGSGIGIITCISMFFFKAFLSKNKRVVFVLIMILFSAILLLYLYSQLFQFSVTRLIDNANETSPLEARISGYDYFNSLPGIVKIFGCGANNLPYDENIYQKLTLIYFSSGATQLCCYGLCGTFLLLFLFYYPIKKGSLFQKVLSCVFLFFSIFSAFITTFTIVYVYLLLSTIHSNGNELKA